MTNTGILSPTTPTEYTKLFSGVGLLEGDLIFSEGLGVIRIGETEYPLYYSPANGARSLYHNLAKNFEHFNKKVLVYPRIGYPIGKDSKPSIGFTLVAVENKSSDGLFKNFKTNQLKLTGIWQWVPVSKIPVISVYRNRTEKLKTEITTVSDLIKMKRLKAQHVPVIWQNPIINPWIYLHGTEEKMDKYFVSIFARFNPQTDQFFFDSLVDLPTVNIPGFYVDRKQVKRQQKPKTEVDKPAKTKVEKPKVKPAKTRVEKPKVKPAKTEVEKPKLRKAS